MHLAQRILVIRAQLALRRAARARRRQLVRELSGYSTQAQRDDFGATLDRYPEGVTYELRAILTRQPPAPRVLPMMQGRR